MGKGIIKVPSGSSSGAGILVNENGKEITYYQPFGKEIGLKEGTVVRFDVYTDPTTKEKTAFNVETYRKGIIVVKETDKGTINDPNYGTLELFEPMMKQQGIVDGSTVKYDVIQVNGINVGIYVKLAEPDKTAQ